jgi:hypothetical protein
MKSLDEILNRKDAEKYEPSSASKTLIMRAKKKNINGVFSWDDDFYKSKSWLQRMIITFDVIGLAIIILTSLESSLVFLAIKALGVLFFIILELIIAQMVRAKDEILNLNKAKYFFYENLFEIYDKDSDDTQESKKLQAKSKTEFEKIERNSRMWFIVLLILALLKCFIFFIDYLFTGAVSIVLLEFPWLAGLYCLIYLIVPFLHFYFYSYLHWIKKAHDEVDNECIIHYQERLKAIENKNSSIDVPNCKMERHISFDVHKLKNKFLVCENFKDFNLESRVSSGIMTDFRGEQIVSTATTSAMRANLRTSKEIFSKFFSFQILKFKIAIAEQEPESGIGHYDDNVRDIQVIKNSL